RRRGAAESRARPARARRRRAHPDGVRRRARRRKPSRRRRSAAGPARAVRVIAPTMRVDVFTIFPEYLDGALRCSIVGRARERGLLDVRLHDPRDHTDDRHRSVDDTPFGGGAGMVMMPAPLFAAVEAAAPPRPLYL